MSSKFLALIVAVASLGLVKASPLRNGIAESESKSDPAELVERARLAAETDHDYNKMRKLTEKANAIWKKNGAKPPEYAESLVWLSLGKLAGSYQTYGATDIEKVYSEWRAESAELLTTAVEVCNANPTAKPEVLALALEMQFLQATDKDASRKLHDQSEEIRSRLTREILPSPIRTGSADDAPLATQGIVQPPTLLKRIEPEFSEPARAARITGTVHFAVVVEADGTPSSVFLLGGLGFGLDEEAAKAVKQWRFNPAKSDGKAVRVQARIDVSFKLL